MRSKEPVSAAFTASWPLLTSTTDAPFRCNNNEINSRLAKNSGDEVHFYGTNDGGDEVRGTLDPSASKSVLRSLDMLGQLVVFIIAISVFGATAWQFYDNRGRSSW